MKTTMHKLSLMVCVVAGAGWTGTLWAGDLLSPAPGANPTATGTNSAVLNVSGHTVVDTNGQPVATIEHIVVSPSGYVQLALLSMGQGKVVGVPWPLLAIQSPSSGTATGVVLQLSVDRAKLRAAPALTLGRIQDLPNSVEQAYRYFGVEPGPAAQAAASRQWQRPDQMMTNPPRLGAQTEQSLRSGVVQPESMTPRWRQGERVLPLLDQRTTNDLPTGSVVPSTDPRLDGQLRPRRQ